MDSFTATPTHPSPRRRRPGPSRTALAAASILASSTILQAMAAPGAATCVALKATPIANTTVTSATYVTAATGNYCLVGATVAPQHDVQVVLPDNWKSRYLQSGGGGFDGNVPDAAAMAAGGAFAAAGDNLVANGYVVTADNGGHRGSQYPGASFAVDRGLTLSYASGKIFDTHLVATALMLQYYGHEARYNYFSGCSNGGKNASVAASNFPDYFDAIIGGDGVWGQARDPVGGSDMAGLTSKWAQTVQLGSITPAQGAALHAAVVNACDGLDGVKDGIVANIQACNIERVAERMRCSAGASGACLSDADFAKVTGYITPLKLDGRVIGAPWSGATDLSLVGASSFGLGSGFLAMAMRTPAPVNPATFDIPRQFADVAAVLDGVYGMTGDLYGIERYLKRGKKLILFHGWEDPVVPSYVSVDFFKALTRAEGEASDNVRLYMDPAVAHCGGGNGADSTDLVAVAAKWVEQNEEPGSYRNPTVAWKRAGASAPADVSGASFTRPLCPYPSYAHYVGRGDVDAAANYVCRPGL
ncbi:tannase/feruloyl esterase family alpha/beta hydrolase [Scleromatobacter humisilvae]|uniref:Tannase/feruloyl esterase family alpha/beta hydrolase n=1 Tax=Scleromatobacter humisilvae TaxID=2897159 RepID=A0A9X1YIM5_9BURK|nr:tannase/feruloyl esterase family alpha/beta hydrolase [Scleromatobacter humisilvae]MCK9686115.1 tannase/feruloyl esterase family alpha/beta hydrolase [Scleromatobacter humisilvae]